MFTPSPAFEISEFAMSPNNNEVHIYAKKGTKWEVENILKEVRTHTHTKLFFSFFFLLHFNISTVLKLQIVFLQHGQRVTGMDWAPKSNQLVTCAAVSVT